MNFQQIEYFIAALEQGNFSRAADSLGISQPSLSNQIIKLESTLGTTLFIRTNRELILTQSGKKFVPYARNCLEMRSEGIAAIRRLKHMEDGVASFGTFGSAHNYFLNRVISKFRARYPKMKLKIYGYNSYEVAEMVGERKLEAGLVMLPVNDRNLIVDDPVWSQRVGYLKSQPINKDHMTIADLCNDKTLILTEAKWCKKDPIRMLLDRHATTNGLTLSPTIEVENQITGIQLATEGIGAIIATRPIIDQLGYGNVLYWVPIEPPIHEVFAFIRHADTVISSPTRVLKRMMQQEIDRIQARWANL